jgi:hypothetical protein
MTEHFNEVQQCVKAYFDELLLRGSPLIAIIDSLKSGPVPQDLLNSKSCAGLTEQDIRRHGQLVGTKYLIRQNNEQSAQLPDNDLLATQTVDKDLGV